MVNVLLSEKIANELVLKILFQQLIKENKLDDKVELGGTFCMGNCQKGVCVTVDDTFHSVTPDSTKEFFEKQVLAKV